MKLAACWDTEARLRRLKRLTCLMPEKTDWSEEETDDPLLADDRNFHKLALV